jgi:hypothetical protein
MKKKIGKLKDIVGSGIALLTGESGVSKKCFCGACGRAYSYRTALARHIKYECGKGPQFKCLYCNKRYTQKYKAVLHSRKKH